MTSTVEICNLALVRLGVQTINALTEGSAQSIHCGLLYEPTRDALLRMVPWRFATARQALAILADATAPAEWSHVYQLPSDCLAARYVEPPDGLFAPGETADQDVAVVSPNASAASKFEVRGRTVVTHQPNAVLIYTARIENPIQFDPLFVEALSYKLAADLAMPLQSDREMRNLMMRDFRLLMSSAMAANGRDALARIDQDASWIAGRA